MRARTRALMGQPGRAWDWVQAADAGHITNGFPAGSGASPPVRGCARQQRTEVTTGKTQGSRHGSTCGPNALSNSPAPLAKLPGAIAGGAHQCTRCGSFMLTVGVKRVGYLTCAQLLQCSQTRSRGVRACMHLLFFGEAVAAAVASTGCRPALCATCPIQ